MPALATTYPREAPPTSATSPQPIALDKLIRMARRRASKIDTQLPCQELVHRTLARFDQEFGIGIGPVDLDGWITRTLRAIVVSDRRVRTNVTSSHHAELLKKLAGLAAPVRSPALAKQRKLLLRRVSELIGGPEARVVFSMMRTASLDRVAQQLGISAFTVAQLNQRGLQRLQARLSIDPELERQLSDASRQPRRARTA